MCTAGVLIDGDKQRAIIAIDDFEQPLSSNNDRSGPFSRAPSALAANRRSTTDPIAADPAWKVESGVLCLYPCHSYKA